MPRGVIQSKDSACSLEAERAYYSKNWPTKALPYRHLKGYVDAWLPEAHDLLSGKSVLDVGAGEATYTRMLAETYGPRLVVACELFPERMLPAALDNRAGNLDFVAGNCLSLPFADHSFDVVFESLVLSQIPDLDKAIDEIHRVLKPGGYLIGIEPNPSNLVVLYRFFRGKHSKNQYLLSGSNLGRFTVRGFEMDVRFFYGRFPKLRSRFLTTCIGILARKKTG